MSVLNGHLVRDIFQDNSYFQHGLQQAQRRSMMNDKDNNNNMAETHGIITHTPSHVSLVSLSRLFGLGLAFPSVAGAWRFNGPLLPAEVLLDGMVLMWSKAGINKTRGEEKGSRVQVHCARLRKRWRSWVFGTGGAPVSALYLQCSHRLGRRVRGV